MELDVRRNGGQVSVDDLPSAGAVRTYALKLDDKARVMMGQLAFVIQYVAPSRGVFASAWAAADFNATKWLLVFLVVAVGLWTAIYMTPKMEIEVSDYLKNPARFAQLIMPTSAQEKKKTFEEIKKKEEEKIKVEDAGKWKKVQSKTKAKDAEIPREVKEKQDRKIATSAGILGLLKGRGGGTGDDSSSVFGGSAMANLDQSLAGLRSTGMGDSGGFGGLGTRGGGPGGGGGGLGLGGLGTAGYGRGGGAGYGSVKIGHRGKHAVRVVKGRTRVVGGLSQEVVGRYIKRYWAQFKYCYERELSKDPNLYGKITITFTIAGNGRVSEAQVIQTTMHNANVEECVLRVVRRIRFPQPKGGGQVIVTYPFMFTTAG
jgi:TonB family protein